MKKIGDGAEAVVYKKAGKPDKAVKAVKVRPVKGYRRRELDEELRRKRTRAEAKALRKAGATGVNAPQVLRVDDKEMVLETGFVKGKRVRDALNAGNCALVCKEIGRQVALLHNAGIVHGDLTTSNFMLSGGRVVFIDFGLSFHSQRVEDKAVDLHLLKEALESKHHALAEKGFREALKAYEKTAAHAKEVFNRLNEIESRGRYKKKAGKPRLLKKKSKA